MDKGSIVIYIVQESRIAPGIPSQPALPSSRSGEPRSALPKACPTGHGFPQNLHWKEQNEAIVPWDWVLWIAAAQFLHVADLRGHNVQPLISISHNGGSREGKAVGSLVSTTTVYEFEWEPSCRMHFDHLGAHMANSQMWIRHPSQGHLMTPSGTSLALTKDQVPSWTCCVDLSRACRGPLQRPCSSAILKPTFVGHCRAVSGAAAPVLPAWVSPLEFVLTLADNNRGETKPNQTKPNTLPSKGCIPSMLR